jgi:hypothetical protein
MYPRTRAATADTAQAAVVQAAAVVRAVALVQAVEAVTAIPATAIRTPIGRRGQRAQTLGGCPMAGH